MNKKTVLFLAVFAVCIGLLTATGCPTDAPDKLPHLSKSIIGTWSFESGNHVLTFDTDGTFDGQFNRTPANGTYSIRGDLVFLEFSSIDLFLVYTVSGAFDGGLYTDDGRRIDPWDQVT